MNSDEMIIGFAQGLIDSIPAETDALSKYTRFISVNLLKFAVLA